MRAPNCHKRTSWQPKEKEGGAVESELKLSPRSSETVPHLEDLGDEGKENRTASAPPIFSLARETLGGTSSVGIKGFEAPIDTTTAGEEAAKIFSSAPAEVAMTAISARKKRNELENVGTDPISTLLECGNECKDNKIAATHQLAGLVHDGANAGVHAWERPPSRVSDVTMGGTKDSCNYSEDQGRGDVGTRSMITASPSTTSSKSSDNYLVLYMEELTRKENAWHR